jgi:radical SAM protein with 4Fe4S-binding SPASM domain
MKMNRHIYMMPIEMFQSIVDQAQGQVREIILWHLGEPFLHPYLCQMIRYVVSRQIRIITSTNGEWVDSQDKAIEVVQSGLNHLIVGMDGVDQETHQLFKRGGNLEKVLRCIRLIVAARREMGSKTPIIELQCILMRQNESQQKALRKLAQELSVDMYTAKPMHINSRYPEFQSLAREFLPNDLSNSPYKKLPDGQFAPKGELKTGCPKVYDRMLIRSDGSVIPCCYDLEGEFVMGNVNSTPLAEIWQGISYNVLRERLKTERRRISLCSTCLEGRKHSVVEALQLR